MEKERKVPRERGQVLAINEGTMFMEVSAKNNKCVESCFTEVIKRIIYLESMNSTYSRSSRSTFALSASSPYQRYSQRPESCLLHSVPETAEDSITRYKRSKSRGVSLHTFIICVLLVYSWSIFCLV